MYALLVPPDFLNTLKAVEKVGIQTIFLWPNADAGSGKISLAIRKWREGDKFKPLGMKGSKLVSDFLIDIEVNVLDKEKQLVLECKDGIIWVIGRRISEDYKVFDEASALKIEFKK